jgi:hypothetical protein
MGISISECFKSINYNKEEEFQINDFLDFCVDKKVKYIENIAEQAYFIRKISYIERGLQTEEFVENRINLYTYKYNDNVIEYATIG